MDTRDPCTGFIVITGERLEEEQNSRRAKVTGRFEGALIAAIIVIAIFAAIGAINAANRQAQAMEWEQV